jgi:leucyl aminopeptidase
MTFIPVVESSEGAAVSLWLVSESDYANWLKAQPSSVQRWLSLQRFKPERGRVLAWADPMTGDIAGAVAGLGALGNLNSLSCWHTLGLSERLPQGIYELHGEYGVEARWQAALGWCLGHYRAGLYKSQSTAELTTAPSATAARLRCPVGVSLDRLRHHVETHDWVRDLINTPAADLGPAELASQMERLAREHGASIDVTVGEALLAQNYPLIHAVGRASEREPRLIDLRWCSPAGGAKITLVGKGVCFDSGGLDLKAASGMALMKKDMAGAAVAIGIARMVMQEQLPVQLRVLVPAVENAVSGNAFRPGDVLRSRRGLTVEIGNTDAEGRLILADALTAADAEQPDLLLDFATLTGAARVALGPELPAFFTDDEPLRRQIYECSRAAHDPVWALPMWDGYDEDLGSRIADLNNVASHSFAGSIIGALFLRRFVSRGRRWAHFDLYGWNARERAGRPIGAEAQCLRLATKLIKDFSKGHGESHKP